MLAIPPQVVIFVLITSAASVFFATMVTFLAYAFDRASGRHETNPRSRWFLTQVWFGCFFSLATLSAVSMAIVASLVEFG